MSKHLRAGSPGAVRPPDDLERDPGINQSKGLRTAGAEPEDLAGDNTFEGDVENDVDPTGAVNPALHGRTNR